MIEYREYSFLQNKRLTPAVKASAIKVMSSALAREHPSLHIVCSDRNNAVCQLLRILQPQMHIRREDSLSLHLR